MLLWSDLYIRKKDIRRLERIQRTATKMVPELKDQNYKERLEEIGLPSLQERRKRGDRITMFKLIINLEKIDREDLVVGVEEGERDKGTYEVIKEESVFRIHAIKKCCFPH